MTNRSSNTINPFPTALVILLIPTLAFAQGTLDQQAIEWFGLQAGSVVTLDVDPTPEIAQDIMIPIDAALLTLNLVPHSVRSGRYEVRVQLADGSLVTVESGPVRTVRGTVQGVDGSSVVGSVSESGLTAVLDLPDGSRYWIEPLFGRIDDATPADHVVYRDEDAAGCGGVCAAGEIAATPPPGESAVLGGGCDTPPCEAELAIDADVEYFQPYQTVEAVERQINWVIHEVNMQYEYDVGITHVITTIIVRTAEPDP